MQEIQNYIVLLSVLVFVSCVSLGSGTEKQVGGTELLFTSEDLEYSNYSCKVVGEIPAWLRGTLIRNGPGKFEMGDRNLGHAFDGYAKLHSFRFGEDQSEVLFSSRFLKTESFVKSTEMNDMYPRFTMNEPQPPLNRLEKMKAFMTGLDNPNINVAEFGGEMVALGNSWKVYTFDRHSLVDATMVNAPLPESLPSIYNSFHFIGSVAHPLQEYGSKAMISLATIQSPLPIYGSLINVVRIHSPMVRELVAAIPVQNTPIMHSFALTQHYAVVFADPFFIGMYNAVLHNNAVNSFEWHPELGTTVYVVRLKDGHVTKMHLPAPAVYHLHQGNAYEEGGLIFIDVVTHPGFSTIYSFNMDTLLNETKRNNIPNLEYSHFHTYKINVTNNTIKRLSIKTKVSDLFDLLAINENYRFKKNYYTYGVVHDLEENTYPEFMLVKRNRCVGTKDIFWKQHNHLASEPVFVPNPNGGLLEDDGVILSVVLDTAMGKSYLLVADAATMTEVARAYTPTHVPFTIHGNFFPESQ